MTPDPAPDAAPRAAPDADPVTVRVQGLTKHYRIPIGVRKQTARTQGRQLPAEVPALAGLDLEVRRGEVYGILGPNGAGKTTLMKILATILAPDQGTVEVLGHDIGRHPERVRAQVGVVLGEYERTFHWRLSGRQNLRFFAAFHAIARPEVDRRIDEALTAVDLTEAADQRFNAYSTGMKHRLALARALLTDPELLILDEPTAGLDPDSSGQIAEVVRARASDGVTVLYTTHRLHEAGVLCDRILVLDKGRRVAEASPEELARLARGNQVIELAKRAGGPWEASFVKPLAARSGVIDWETRGARLLLYTPNDDDIVRDVVDAARRAGPETLQITVRPPSVEDAFTDLIRRNRQDEPTAEVST